MCKYIFIVSSIYYYLNTLCSVRLFNFLKSNLTLNRYTTPLFPSTFFQIVKNQFLGQIGGTSQCHIQTLYQFFALGHSNRSKIGPRTLKIGKKSFRTCQFQSLKISYFGWLGDYSGHMAVQGAKLPSTLGTPLWVDTTMW